MTKMISSISRYQISHSRPNVIAKRKTTLRIITAGLNSNKVESFLQVVSSNENFHIFFPAIGGKCMSSDLRERRFCHPSVENFNQLKVVELFKPVNRFTGQVPTLCAYLKSPKTEAPKSFKISRLQSPKNSQFIYHSFQPLTNSGTV